MLPFVAMGTDAVRSADDLFLCNYACVGREEGVPQEYAAIQCI